METTMVIETAESIAAKQANPKPNYYSDYARENCRACGFWMHVKDREPMVSGYTHIACAKTVPTYTESETGADLCGVCDEWIDGVGANACVCCRTCDGDGRLLACELECDGCADCLRHDGPCSEIHGERGKVACTDCNGTGTKEVAQ